MNDDIRITIQKTNQDFGMYLSRNLAAMFVLGALVWTNAAAAQDRTQSRWTVISVNGIVAGEQPLAAQIGAGILASGGNAVDAAVAQAHAQFVSNVVDFNMNIQAAMEAARFSKDSFGGCDVQMEARIPADVRDALAALGHQIKVRGVYSPGATGGGQAVMRDFARRVNYGASDPRKDGAAIPEPITAQ